MAENQNINEEVKMPTEKELGEQEIVRREKLAALCEAGKNPYELVKYPVDAYSEDIKADFENLENKTVVIAGRMMSKRVMGKASFCNIQDGKGRIQCYVARDEIGEEPYAAFKKLDIGDIVGITGFVFKTKTGETSVHAKELVLLSKSLKVLPEKFHGLTDQETRYRQRYVDLIVNPEVKNTFLKRSQILSEIVTTGKTRLKTVYDPTCGSGSLLLRTARGGNADAIYGQEKNPTTFNLARMNMLLHGVKYKDFKIENGDTLEADEFGEQQFDAVVANPPFSAEWSADNKFNNDDRFSKAGVLAPKSKADYAFILHMIYHLNDGGTMACVAPHGVLFRGSAEGKIRQYLIEKKNYIDAIIGLPANIFYGTSIPTCILVMKKCRKEDDNILFIDASKEFEKVKTQNKLRPEHIQKIVDTYRNRTEIEKYSHLASLEEIKENDYNLNIPRYVDTFEEEEEIDIKAVMAEIKELEAKRADLDAQIEVYLKELGIVE